jgi:glycosyltransferase involved in cell wall biosynthesis
MSAISVVVPCYNHEATLPRAIASARAQVGVGEIIVVDDGSTDGSANLADRLAGEDSRLIVIRSARNAGPGAARNLGVRHANGEFISFLDADDELLDGFIAAATDMLAVNAHMAMVKSEVEFFDPVKGYVLLDIDRRYPSVVLSGPWAALIRRSAFERIGGFPEDPAFRGPNGGEDVAFMEAVIRHLQPIGRLARPGYRLWSQTGSHLDRFLANTRQTNDGFEFISLDADQQPDGPVAQALDRYLRAVDMRMKTSN